MCKYFNLNKSSNSLILLCFKGLFFNRSNLPGKYFETNSTAEGISRPYSSTENRSSTEID